MASPNFSDNCLDGGLDYLIANADRIDACTTEPTNVTEARTTFTVGNYTITGGDFTKANGDVDGRKVTLASQTGNNGTGNGAANFLAYTSVSELIGVLDADGEVVNSGSPFSVAQHDPMEIADPVNA